MEMLAEKVQLFLFVSIMPIGLPPFILCAKCVCVVQIGEAVKMFNARKMTKHGCLETFITSSRTAAAKN